MATAKDKETVAETAEAPGTDAPEITDDTLIPRERLIAQAREFTGFEPHEVAGALAGVDGDAFDPGHAKEITSQWLVKPEEEAA